MCFLFRPDNPTPAAADAPQPSPAPALDTSAAQADDAGGTTDPTGPPAVDGGAVPQPGAVVTCPCVGAAIASQAVLHEPADRARTRLGVGESTTLTYSLGIATWSLVGGGTLDTTSGSSVIYTAGNQAETVTITATDSCCSASITFTIVEPVSVRQIKKFTSATRIRHVQTRADIGMITNVFFAPDDVNFHMVQWLELEVNNTATGPWACINNTGHGPNLSGLPFTTHVQPGMGTWLAGQDNLFSGWCGSWVAGTVGQVRWGIPNRWRVGTSGAWKHMNATVQLATCDAAGNLRLTKAGSLGTCRVADPTSAA